MLTFSIFFLSLTLFLCTAHAQAVSGKTNKKEDEEDPLSLSFSHVIWALRPVFTYKLKHEEIRCNLAAAKDKSQM